MNDNNRQEWVMNDEGLYCWFRNSRMPIRRFIRENREELTVFIKWQVGDYDR